MKAPKEFVETTPAQQAVALFEEVDGYLRELYRGSDISTEARTQLAASLTGTAAAILAARTAYSSADAVAKNIRGIGAALVHYG